MSGAFEKILSQKKPDILKEWFTLVIETYPEETAKFLKSQKDPFANPVGRAVQNAVDDLFGELMRGVDPKTAAAYLDPMIRIRAVQNFTPSEAVGFIFTLKKVIRALLEQEGRLADLSEQLQAFNSKIDELALIAFDVYMKCREKIYEIKAKEFRNRHYSAFRRAGLISEVPDDPDLGQ